jgi:uncharacterized repeat protein (TIGR03803 family)
LALAVLAPSGAEAGYRVLYTFKDGADGGDPYAGLIMDAKGNIYGATVYFGDSSCSYFGETGCGTVFRIAPDGKETTLHTFTGGSDGANPYGGLVMDKAGNLYGTTFYGGGAGGDDCYNAGCGTVYRIAPDGSETVLHAFAGGSDGSTPASALIMDKAGDLYGTTVSGGAAVDCEIQPSGCGTVFKITPAGAETVLYAFQGGSDGGLPYAGLIQDKSGNIYGATVDDTIFKLAPDGSETVLHLFDGKDGSEPYGGLIMDAAGDLYGTTAWGGLVEGTAFELSPDGTLTTLHNFTDQPDGALPYGGLAMDKTGDLYGTTNQGGKKCGFYGSTCGIVFKLAPDGSETVLHSFDRRRGDGLSPYAGLIMDKKGNLYGATYWSERSGGGTVFEITR